jgi:transposase
LTHLWAAKGTRPTVWRQTQYDYLYVFGAVCPQTGQSAGLLAPWVNTSVVNAFLREFSGELAPDVQAVLIWDQAGFHTAKDVCVPENITIIPLPPYSPQLNPVEKLWQYLRQHYWSNRVYADYDALRIAAIDAWQQVALKPNLVKSICRAEYIERALF